MCWNAAFEHHSILPSFGVDFRGGGSCTASQPGEGYVPQQVPGLVLGLVLGLVAAVKTLIAVPRMPLSQPSLNRILD